eukprot:gnl/Spiro4/26520_TR13198_c0_g1_i1.p1 gnl/Spiro4/26520_TR13198_c0_g1~~gnl/Spiro4/26520_TR13198_c0_g1_i1.p1  ORF type:complete len:354 (-),score=75.02 gnl/Spiro4/26520_TR13198_c0_g1_i1:60-983(-)
MRSRKLASSPSTTSPSNSSPHASLSTPPPSSWFWRSCTWCFRVLAILIIIAVVVFVLVKVFGLEHAIMRRLMRLGRDISRAKAHHRLHNNSWGAVVPVLMGTETPLALPEDLPTTGPTFTEDELLQYDGTDPSLPIYIAVKGRVYDVTLGSAFYGPGGKYAHFAGHDCSRALCEGCLEERCVTGNLTGLSRAEMRDCDRWVELFEFHDKYKYVGMIRNYVPYVPPDEDAEGDRRSNRAADIESLRQLAEEMKRAEEKKRADAEKLRMEQKARRAAVRANLQKRLDEAQQQQQQQQQHQTQPKQRQTR